MKDELECLKAMTEQGADQKRKPTRTLSAAVDRMGRRLSSLSCISPANLSLPLDEKPKSAPPSILRYGAQWSVENDKPASPARKNGYKTIPEEQQGGEKPADQPKLRRSSSCTIPILEQLDHPGARAGAEGAKEGTQLLGLPLKPRCHSFAGTASAKVVDYWDARFMDGLRTTTLCNTEL